MRGEKWFHWVTFRYLLFASFKDKPFNRRTMQSRYNNSELTNINMLMENTLGKKHGKRIIYRLPILFLKTKRNSFTFKPVNENTNTVEPPFWDTSIQGTPNMFMLIFVCSIWTHIITRTEPDGLIAQVVKHGTGTGRVQMPLKPEFCRLIFRYCFFATDQQLPW